MGDADRIVSMESLTRANLAALRQLEPHVWPAEFDPAGFPVSRVVKLSKGVYRFAQAGLLPIAFRITNQPSGEDWFNQQDGEIIRLADEPLIRMVNADESIQFRPIFPFPPFPQLALTQLARPDTYGG